MTDPESLITVDHQPALEIMKPGVRMLFGFGPPAPGGPPEQRMQRVLAALNPEVTAIRWGEQIHGRVVASLAPEPGQQFRGTESVGRCDALIAAERGLGLVVWTADCVPILISGGNVVAGVHSGWRGSVADVVGAVVNRFSVEFGEPPEALRAVLGPAISGPRYEVSSEVISGLAQYGLEQDRWRSGHQVDLRAFLACRLVSLGLDEAEIAIVGPCTASTPELASYRRDGARAGRQWSMIYRRKSG
jgi:YfiH family protein